MKPSNVLCMRCCVYSEMYRTEKSASCVLNPFIMFIGFQDVSTCVNFLCFPIYSSSGLHDFASRKLFSLHIVEIPEPTDFLASFNRPLYFSSPHFFLHAFSDLAHPTWVSSPLHSFTHLLTLSFSSSSPSLSSLHLIPLSSTIPSRSLLVYLLSKTDCVHPDIPSQRVLIFAVI